MDAKFDVFAGGLREIPECNPGGGTGGAIPTVLPVAEVAADITFSTSKAVYRFAPQEASSITFTAPELNANEVFQCELWITQPESPVSLTLPVIKWGVDKAPVMFLAGDYHITLQYDGADWYGKLNWSDTVAFPGDWTKGDGGVYLVVDGEAVLSAAGVGNINADYEGAVIYCFRDDSTTGSLTGCTVSNGGVIYVGGYIEGLNNGEGGLVDGGVVNDLTLAEGGELRGNYGTVNNLTMTGGSIPDVTCVVFNDCTFLGGEVPNPPDGIDIVGGTIGIEFDLMYSDASGVEIIDRGHLSTCGRQNTYKDITLSGGGVLLDNSKITNLVNNGGMVNFFNSYGGIIDGYTQTAGSIDSLFGNSSDSRIKNFNISGGTVEDVMEACIENGVWDIDTTIEQPIYCVGVQFLQGGVYTYSDSSTITDCVFEDGASISIEASGATVARNVVKSGASLTIYADQSALSNEEDCNIIEAGATVFFPPEYLTIAAGVWYAKAGAIVNDVELMADQWIENVATGE